MRACIHTYVEQKIHVETILPFLLTPFQKINSDFKNIFGHLCFYFYVSFSCWKRGISAKTPRRVEKDETHTSCWFCV